MPRPHLSLLTTLLLLTPAVASDYRTVRHVYPRYAAHAPYAPYAAPQFFYFVGAPVRIEALLEAEKRRDPEYRQFLEYQARRAYTASPPGSQEAAAVVQPAGDDGYAAPGAVMARRCASCHSGDAPEGGLRLDGRSPLSAGQITAAQRRVLQGAMPPGEALAPGERRRVLEDLLRLEAVDR